MFQDRADAGAQLAEALARAPLPLRPVVFALPRGGVPVALPVAGRLGAPLDLLMVRKLGLPGQPEVAAGAVVDGAAHDVVFNERIMRAMSLTEADFVDDIRHRLAEIKARRAKYLKGRAPIDVAGRCAIVVDDGIATGATVRAALRALRRRAPSEIILAVPVAPADAIDELKPLVDRLVCLETPAPFWAVGAAYRVFDQVSDDTVAQILNEAPIDGAENAEGQNP